MESGKILPQGNKEIKDTNSAFKKRRRKSIKKFFTVQ
jgi:hypothetical protein